MASRKMFFYSKPRYIYPTMDFDDQNHLEFDEVDIWNNSNDQNFEPKKPLPSLRASSKKIFKKMEIQDHNYRRNTTQIPAAATSASLPVKIPDWSKILKAEYKDSENIDEEDVTRGGGDDDGDRIPPHEYLARRRGASFSVHEGIGRTLKGRDLRRVRNAVWKKTGFED